MKLKLMIMVALGAVSICAQAQTEKGKKFINGSVGYSSTKNETREFSGLQNGKSKSYYILPSFGYFFRNNASIGAGLGYSKSKSDATFLDFSSSSISTYLQTSEQSSIDASLFLRYYIDVAEKFKFFGQISPSIGLGKGEQSISQSYFNGTQTINNLKGSLFALLSGVQMNNFGYYIITCTK